MMVKKNSSRPAIVFFLLVVAVAAVIWINASALWRFRLVVQPTSTRLVVHDHGPHSRFRKPIIKKGPLILKKQSPVATSAITCDRSHQTYDICSIHAPTLLDPANATFYLVHPSTANAPPPPPEKIRPHPRKGEVVMSLVEEFSLTTATATTACDINHPVPAVMFSASGYVGNVWHEFNDILIPLFITAHTIYPGSQGFVPVVESATELWVQKYTADLLPSLSKHPTLIINRTAGGVRHCFPSATLGLIRHGYMTVNTTLIPAGKNLSHFREVLDAAYAGHKSTPNTTKSVGRARRRRPRLVFVVRSRSQSRILLNQEEVRKAAEGAGFEVVVFEPQATTPLKEVYELFHSSHALLGLHGAGLTHFLFLCPGAIFVQIVPLGVDWPVKVCFGDSARILGLDYAEYKIGLEESSLTEKYGRQHELITDLAVSRGDSWGRFTLIYLREQNVTVDLNRFGGILKDTYVKAKKFMEDQG